MFQPVRHRLSDVDTAEPGSPEDVEAGFTLIELMVVLLIIAILLAIAIPTFLGVTGSANDRAAQSNLTNGITEASAVFQANNQSFSGISAALVTSAPEFSWVAGGTQPTAGSNQISVNPVDVSAVDSKGVVMASLSKNGGMCWFVAQLTATPAPVATTGFELTATPGQAGYEAGATTAGTFYAKSTTSGVCKATYPETKSTGFSWGTTYANAPVN